MDFLQRRGRGLWLDHSMPSQFQMSKQHKHEVSVSDLRPGLKGKGVTAGSKEGLGHSDNHIESAGKKVTPSSGLIQSADFVNKEVWG